MDCLKSIVCSCGHADYDHGDLKFNCLADNCSCLQFNKQGTQAPQKALAQHENYLERIAIALERIAERLGMMVLP